MRDNRTQAQAAITTPATDAELLRLVQSGDSTAFSVLYRRHQRSVYRFALAYCGAGDRAADVTQEVFMQLIANATYDPACGSLANYLLGVARNLVRRQRRAERRHVALPAVDSEPCLPALVDDHEPLLDLMALRRQHDVRGAIAALPPAFREVVILCEIQELAYVDAAAILGIPLGTVRSRLHRARKAMATMLTAPDASADPDLDDLHELRAV